MERIVTHSVGLFSLGRCQTSWLVRRTGVGEDATTLNGKVLDELSKGRANRASAVPDRQGTCHATGRNLDHLMSDKLQKQSKLQQGCERSRSASFSGLQLWPAAGCLQKFSAEMSRTLGASYSLTSDGNAAAWWTSS